MSQSLQDIRPLFLAMLNSLNCICLFALLLHTEQNVINYLMSRIHASGLLLTGKASAEFAQSGAESMLIRW